MTIEGTRNSPKLATYWIIEETSTNFKGFQDLQTTFFDHSETKLEINKKEKTRNFPQLLGNSAMYF